MKHMKLNLKHFEKDMKLKLSDPKEICEMWNDANRTQAEKWGIRGTNGICVCAVWQTGAVNGIDQLTQTWALTAKFHGLGIDV